MKLHQPKDLYMLRFLTFHQTHDLIWVAFRYANQYYQGVSEQLMSSYVLQFFLFDPYFALELSF